MVLELVGGKTDRCKCGETKSACIYIYIFIFISICCHVLVSLASPFYMHIYLYLPEHKNCYVKDYTNHVHLPSCYIRFIKFTFCPEKEKKTRTIRLEKTFCGQPCFNVTLSYSLVSCATHQSLNQSAK